MTMLVCPGRPSTPTTAENIATVKKMILDNHQITVREIADDVGILFGLCQAIVMDVLRIKRETTTIIPKLLNFEKKQRRMEILATFNDD